MPVARRASLALAALALALAPGAAEARAVRRLFEPGDLEIEDPGMVDSDFQVGPLWGRDAFRLSIPDFEFDLGIVRDLELDVDGSLLVQESRVDADNLWVAGKATLLSIADPDDDMGWGLGVQLGPKVPLARGAHGLGAEALLLAGMRIGRTRLVLNVGGLLDPAADGARARPRGFEAGLDFARPLDGAGRWSAVAQIGGVAFLSSDPNQLAGTAGIAWAPADTFVLSFLTLVGVFEGSDRYAVLLGVSPKLRAWRP